MYLYGCVCVALCALHVRLSKREIGGVAPEEEALRGRCCGVTHRSLPNDFWKNNFRYTIKASPNASKQICKFLL
jgi:hypothetical protein